MRKKSSKAFCKPTPVTESLILSLGNHSKRAGRILPSWRTGRSASRAYSIRTRVRISAIPGPEPFEPHITLGLFAQAAEAEQVARIVERQHLPMHGRVEELALLRRHDDGLETLASVRLMR